MLQSFYIEATPTHTNSHICHSHNLPHIHPGIHHGLLGKWLTQRIVAQVNHKGKNSKVSQIHERGGALKDLTELFTCLSQKLAFGCG